MPSLSFSFQTRWLYFPGVFYWPHTVVYSYGEKRDWLSIRRIPVFTSVSRGCKSIERRPWCMYILFIYFFLCIHLMFTPFFFLSRQISNTFLYSYLNVYERTGRTWGKGYWTGKNLAKYRLHIFAFLTIVFFIEFYLFIISLII